MEETTEEPSRTGTSGSARGTSGSPPPGGPGPGDRRRHLAARHALLPLRLFLGITFFYAGLDKLATPTFLDASAPTSMLAQMTAVPAGSPIGFLVGLAAHAPTATGLLVAFGELAVGLGTLFGLFARIAAAGGAVISLTLWLTVSWSASPYYLGNDLAYLMAWLPLVLAGAPVLSLDAWRASRVRQAAGRGGPAAARRRLLLDGGTAAAGVAVLGGAGGLLALLLGGRRPVRRRAPSPSPSASAPGDGAPAGSAPPPSAPPSASPTAGPTGGGPMLPAARVPVGGSARIEDPSSGDPVFVVQPKPGVYRALSGVCTHQGCEVNPPSGGELVCPCHGSRFDAAGGRVLHGPATEALPRYPVHEKDGRLQVEL